MSVANALAHRRFLQHDAGFHPFEGTELFARIGGQPTVDRFVDALYDGFAADELLSPLFGGDLGRERKNQKRFFAEWLGGPRRNSDSGYALLQHTHDGLPITRDLAGRWLGHFRHALETAVTSEPERAAIFAQAETLAFALVNQDAELHARRRTDVAWCGVEARVLTRAAEFAQRGQLSGLRDALAGTPDLRRPTFAAKLLQTAALAGQTDAVALLLDAGVDLNKPHYLATSLVGPALEHVLFVTPLCAARWKRRSAVAALLLERGALEDVFTASLLGEMPRLLALLAAEPELAHTSDPATDALDITPVQHAVAGERLDALRALLAASQAPLKAGGRALRAAAERENLGLVELLLERDVDASLLSAGRWVLHPELAPLLAARGAAVDRSGDWIRLSCTGNQGRKDDPEYVRALLAHGARADDRRADTQATALHYAAKAGFLRTIAVLLEHGADPSARDAHDCTPLDWLEQAVKSIDRAAVRRLLAAR